MDSRFVENVERIPSRFTEIHGWTVYGLIRTIKPKVLIETGTCSGYLTAFMARGALDVGAKFYSIDYYNEGPPHAEPGSIELVQERLDACGVLSGATLIASEAVGAMESLSAAGDLDGLGMALFDDLHSYRQVTKEIEISMRHLTEFGIVGGHDSLCKDFKGVNQAYREAVEKYALVGVWSPHSQGYCWLQRPPAVGFAA